MTHYKTNEALSTFRALKMALEALEGLADYRYTERVKQALAAIRTALASKSEALMSVPDGAHAPTEREQPAPATELREQQSAKRGEPYGYLKLSTAKFFHEVEGCNPKTNKNYLPLYTSPQPSKPWSSLTEEEIQTLLSQNRFAVFALVRAIEAKLKEKNGF